MGRSTHCGHVVSNYCVGGVLPCGSMCSIQVRTGVGRLVPIPPMWYLCAEFMSSSRGYAYKEFSTLPACGVELQA